MKIVKIKIKINNHLGFEDWYEVHSNIEYTKELKDLISKVEGVTNVFTETRYEVKIIIGKCFDHNDVISLVTTEVYKYHTSKND